MPVKVRPTASPSLLAAAVIGLPGSVVVAVLLAWRLGITSWEAVQTSCQVFLFVLGCWILPKDTHGHGPGWRLLSFVGATFTALRMFNYICTLLAPTPIPEYAALFQCTTFGYAITGLFAAESTFMQVLLHRLLPGWACVVSGGLQALLYACINLRYVDANELSPWMALRILATPQVGMFAPFYLSRQWWRQRAALTCPKLPAPTMRRHEIDEDKVYRKKKELEEQSQPEYTGTMVQPAVHASPLTTGVCTLNEASSSSPMPAAAVTSTALSHKVASKSNYRAVGRLLHSLAAVLKHSGDMMPLSYWRGLHVHHYKAQHRRQHTICVKLDIELSCSRLPHNIAQRLQASLHACSTPAAVWCISGVAVRQGCLAITLNIEEHQLLGSAAQNGFPPSPLCSRDLARTLLPELQDLLKQPGTSAAFTRATVQLDDDLVVSLWQEREQPWGWQIHDRTATQGTSDGYWVGIASATHLLPAAAPMSGLHISKRGPQALDLLAEVQLWGGSKVVDLEGWSPDPQHSSINNLHWFANSIGRHGMGARLKLLAQAAGGYLPTQVLRLIPGSTDRYITAQVLVQLHEHQLVRHHEGGAPSTLLLMDIELWQNEVLLSSSPLLSVPSMDPEAAKGCTSPVAWWWGAADRVVAGAVTETQQCCEGCIAAASNQGAPAAIQAYIQFLQDLGVWLAQVERTAHCHKLCCCQAPAVNSDTPLQQPALPINVLQELGAQLMQYAADMGWQQTRLMVSQQMRSIVQQAALRSSQPLRRKTFSAGLQNVWAWFLGYPCHHDERLYKQQLAVYLTGVQTVSSMASVLIGAIWGVRAVGSHATPVVGRVWALLHFAAVMVLLHARAQHSRSGNRQHPSITTAGSQPSCALARAAPRALSFVTLAYVWRNTMRAVWTALAVFSRPLDIHLAVYQHAWFWVMLHSVLLLTDQVPASVVLPAPCLTAITLALEVPAATHDLMRATGAHPAVSALSALSAVLGARAFMEWQMRKHVSLSQADQSPEGHLESPAHAKAD